MILFLVILFSIPLFGQEETANISDIPNYEILKTKMKLDDVVTIADKAPEFPGGMEAFHRKFAQNMDIIDVNSDKINTKIYFIVEKNGYVRYVTALGDDKKHSQAAEVAMRRMFIRWKPAIINNEPVRFLYSFPLALKKY